MTPNPQYDRGTCYFCHEPDTHLLETHHIVPKRFGGSDDAENLVRVCPNCHERLERLYDGRFYDALGVEQPELDDEADSDGRDEVTSLEQRQRIETIKSIISEGESINRDGAPILTVLNRAEANGIERSQAEHEIEKLRQQGDVYEPNTDHLRVV